MFPERFSNLPAYPFARLRALLDPHPSYHKELNLTIGQPTHSFPHWIVEIVTKNAIAFNSYPSNDGIPELRNAICDWAERRYGVKLDPDKNVMALNGTREGLYNATVALCPETKNKVRPLILIPNPFYQVYMFAALSVGARPEFVAATSENGFLPDYTILPEAVLNQTAIAYICSPANPQGAVANQKYWEDLIALAEKYDFKIFADECYSEIYRKGPPKGALEVSMAIGADPERIMVFNSLSKRSNLPGLRSGFVAGGEKSIEKLKTMRAYSGAPLPLPLQFAAEAVWRDEIHVQENRQLYSEKFDFANNILGDISGLKIPEAGFFLWLPCGNGEEAAIKLWKEEGIRVLPGRYLSQDVHGVNPGHGYIRVALVMDKMLTEKALLKVRSCLYSN